MTEIRITSSAPTQFLEQQAADQRRRIHESVTELRHQVRGTVRDKLDVRKHARQYVWPAAGTSFLFSLLFGFGTAGVLKHLFGGHHGHSEHHRAHKVRRGRRERRSFNDYEIA